MLTLALLLIAPPAKPSAVPPQVGDIEVPFLKTNEALIVDAMANGRKMSLMFDTGFSGTIVLESPLDVGPATGSMTLRDFVGEFQAKTVKVKSLMLGTKSIDPADKEIVLQPGGGISSSYGVHCDGIMGFQVVKDNIIEFNFEKSKLIFHPKTYDISTRVPDNKRTFLCRLLPTGHNSMEMTVTASTGKKMILALDTGNAFYATTHKDVLQRIGLWGDQEPKFTKLSGVASGAVGSWYYRMKDVSIWGVPVAESFWDIIDAPAGSAEGDGTVGYQFLKNFNITIDYERRRVWLENFSGKVSNESPASIGISAAYDERVKRVLIYRVSPESPADKAGIKAGDYLLSIDGTDATFGSFRELERLMEGADGSPVRVSTSRNGVLTRHELKRVRLVNES